MAYCLRTKQILPCCSPCLTVEKQCLLIGSLVKSEVTESETEQFPGSSEFLHLNLSLSLCRFMLKVLLLLNILSSLVSVESPLLARCPLQVKTTQGPLWGILKAAQLAVLTNARSFPLCIQEPPSGS